MRRLLLAAGVVCAAILVWAIMSSRAEKNERTGRAERESPTPPAAPTEKGDADETPADDGCADDEPSELAFRFRVRTDADEQPVADVRITIEPLVDLVTKTNRDGRATLTWTAAKYGERYPRRWVARKEGHVPASGYAIAGDIDVHLQPGQVVSGRVMHAIENAPIAGAAVRAWDLDEEEELGSAETTDAEGRFVLAGVRTDRPFVVVANVRGYAPAVAKRTARGPTKDLVLTVGSGGTVEGVVLDASGEPVVDREVFVVAPNDPPLPFRADGRRLTGDIATLVEQTTPRALTDERGAFTIRGLRIERTRALLVNMSAEFHGRSEAFAFARDGERLRRDIRLPAPASVRVFGKDADGKAMTFQATLVSNGARYSRNRARPEEDGSQFFEELTPGTYTLRIFPDSGPMIEEQLTLAPGEKAVHHVQAKLGAVLEGVVVDADGTPVRADVTWWSKQGSAMGRTDAAGRFRLTGLVAEPGTFKMSPELPFAVDKRTDLRPGGAPVRIVARRAAVVTGSLSEIPVGTEVELDYRSKSVGGRASFELAADRRFRLDNQYLGEKLTLQVVVKGRTPIVLHLSALRSGETRELGDLPFERGRTAQGRVVDEKGRAIAGAKVRVVELWSSLRDEARTDARGVFRIVRMPRGALRLKISATGYATHLLRIEDPDTAAPPTLTIGRGGFVAGRAFLDGKPAGAVDVWFTATDKPGYDPDTISTGVKCKPDASFRLELQPGSYEARVWDDKAKENRVVAFKVRKGDTTDIEVR